MGTLDREKPKTGVTLRTEQQDQGHDPEHPRDDLRDTRAFLTPGSVVAAVVHRHVRAAHRASTARAICESSRDRNYLELHKIIIYHSE